MGRSRGLQGRGEPGRAERGCGRAGGLAGPEGGGGGSSTAAPVPASPRTESARSEGVVVPAPLGGESRGGRSWGRGRATVVWGLPRRRPALTLAQLRGETRGEAPSLTRGKPGRGDVPVALLGPVGPVLPVPAPDGGSEGRTNSAQPTPVAGGAPALCPAQPHSLESGGPPGPGASPCRGPSLSGAHVPTDTPIQVLPAVTSFTPVLEKQPTGVQRDGLTLSSCGGWKIQNLRESQGRAQGST